MRAVDAAFAGDWETAHAIAQRHEDIIPNQIAAACLDLGKRLLEEEAAWSKAPPETHTRLSP
jgi:hypothetical protein